MKEATARNKSLLDPKFDEFIQKELKKYFNSLKKYSITVNSVENKDYEIEKIDESKIDKEIATDNTIKPIAFPDDDAALEFAKNRMEFAEKKGVDQLFKFIEEKEPDTAEKPKINAYIAYVWNVHVGGRLSKDPQTLNGSVFFSSIKKYSTEIEKITDKITALITLITIFAKISLQLKTSKLPFDPNDLERQIETIRHSIPTAMDVLPRTKKTIGIINLQLDLVKRELNAYIEKSIGASTSPLDLNPEISAPDISPQHSINTSPQAQIEINEIKESINSKMNSIEQKLNAYVQPKKKTNKFLAIIFSPITVPIAFFIDTGVAVLKIGKSLSKAFSKSIESANTGASPSPKEAQQSSTASILNQIEQVANTYQIGRLITDKIEEANSSSIHLALTDGVTYFKPMWRTAERLTDIITRSESVEKSNEAGNYSPPSISHS